MLLDLKGLTANLEESQARLTERLDQIVELLETLVALEERGHRAKPAPPQAELF